ncbi:replication factor A2 [Lentinula edodes]|uniref:Replication factor A2 n=2 Tax=Lentinula edodes TaxID=5353 RepID=A0A1Q3E1N6_LENED|nr:replication factor A2 [Lentinula edodes]
MDSDPDSDSNHMWSKHLAKEAPHSIRHVSIRQLLKADLPYEKALFSMNDKPFKRVIVVGNVRQKTVTPNQIAYKLDDGSGCIMARFWRDPTLEQDFVDDDITSELRFVRAVGELNEFKTTARGIKIRSLLLQSLEYIEDPHEVFHHIAQIIVDTQTALHGQPSMASARPAPSEISRDLQDLQLHSEASPDLTEDDELTDSVSRSVDVDSVLETPAKVRNARYLPPPSPTPRPRRAARGRDGHTLSSGRGDSAESGPSRIAGLRYPPTTLKPLREEQSSDLGQIILSVISDSMAALRTSRPTFTYEGIRRGDIVEQVLNRTPSISLSQVNETLRCLVDRADIYETIDENHFDLLD